MRLPALRGVIRRRVLVNFRVDPRVIQHQLPPPFRPKLVDNWAIAGICPIRLEQLRPGRVPARFGMSSDNAAHRIAVTWTDASGHPRDGVYIPRRDTASRVTALLGGRLFPGEHQPARFSGREGATSIDLTMHSLDGTADVRLRVHATDRLPSTSCFRSLDAASAFFLAGSVGYSATRDRGRLDGLELRTAVWHVEPLHVESVYSRYFADPERFPPGSIAFDSALLIRNVPHEWHPVAGSPAAVPDCINTPCRLST